MARNRRLQERIASQLAEAEVQYHTSGNAARIFTRFSYRRRRDESYELQAVSGLSDATLQMGLSMDEIVASMGEINIAIQNINEISNMNHEMILDIGERVDRFEV